MKYVSGVRSRCNYLIFPFVIYSKIAKVFSLRHIINRKTDILQTDLMENFVAIKCCAASTYQCMRKSPAVDAVPTTVRGSNGDANDLSKLSKLAWPVIWPSLQYIVRFDSTAVAQHNACCGGLPKNQITLRCAMSVLGPKLNHIHAWCMCPFCNLRRVRMPSAYCTKVQLPQIAWPSTHTHRHT